MNCKTAQKYVLLEQSGELAPRKQYLLNEHLDRCASCAEFSAYTRGLTRAASIKSDESVVSESTIQRIMTESQRHEDEMRQRPPVRRKPVLQMWSPAFASVAAALLLLLGGMVLISRMRSADQVVGSVAATVPATVETWDDDFDSDIAELEELLVVASAEIFGSETASESNEDSTDSLARQLLALEESS